MEVRCSRPTCVDIMGRISSSVWAALPIVNRISCEWCCARGKVDLTLIVVVVVHLVWGVQRIVVAQSSRRWVVMSIVLWMINMRVVGGHWRIVALVIIFSVGAWGIVAWGNAGID